GTTTRTWITSTGSPTTRTTATRSMAAVATAAVAAAPASTIPPSSSVRRCSGQCRTPPSAVHPPGPALALASAPPGTERKPKSQTPNPNEDIHWDLGFGIWLSDLAFLTQDGASPLLLSTRPLFSKNRRPSACGAALLRDRGVRLREQGRPVLQLMDGL